MQHDRFKELLEELDGNSVSTLAEKNARYSSTDDALHNFKVGAEIMGCTPAQACWGYMTKHLTALRDKVERNDFSNREDLLEKCQDTINYIRFLWCIGNEGVDKEMNEIASDISKNKIYEVINRIDSTYKRYKCGKYGGVEIKDDHFTLIDNVGTTHKFSINEFKCHEIMQIDDKYFTSISIVD